MPLQKVLTVIFGMSVFPAGLTAYGYFKSYFWPEVAATVLSTREICHYKKSARTAALSVTIRRRPPG